MIQRKPDESIKDYQIRLCENKELYNLTWQDVANLLNNETGNDYTESRYRKFWAAFQQGLDYASNKFLTDNDLFIELERKKIALAKERNKLSSIRHDLNRAIRESSRAELLLEEFKNAVANADDIELPKFQPLKTQSNKREFLLCFSDVHFGKEFESVNNYYNLDILYNRFDQLMGRVIGIIEKENISHLHILNLADSIEGMCLRVSQLSSLQIGMVDQVIQFARFIVSWITQLSAYVEITFHQVPASNHSQIRPYSSKSNEFVKEDMERFVMTYIHDMLKSNERIHVPEYLYDYVRLDVCGYKIIAKHGHNIKNTDQAIKDLSALHREFFDYLIVGHLHHNRIVTVGEGESNNCEVIRVPSIMGSDELSDRLCRGSKPGALLICFNDDQGKEITYDIILK